MQDILTSAMNGGLGGQEFSVAELRDIAKGLEDAALGIARSGINYPLQGVQYDSTTLSPNGELSPLVAQSIQNTLDSTTFTAQDIRFWPMLTQVDVTQPLHEYNLVHQYGSFAVDPFFAEGGIGAVGEPVFERKTVRMKYMMEVIQLTDVAVMTGLMAPSSSAVAMRTEQGTLSLTQKLENLLFWSDSELNPNQFDGLFASITRGAPSNITNARGTLPSLTKLNEILGTMVQPEIYARPNMILCDYAHFQGWVNEAVTYGRYNQAEPQNGMRGLYYGQDKLFVGTPYGRVEIVPIPFLRQRKNPIARAQGDGAPTALVPTFARAAATTGSDWQTADITSDYLYYIIEMYGDRGTTPTVAAGGVQLTTALDAVRIDIPDSAVASSGSGSIKWYKVYRAASATAAAPTDLKSYEFVGSFPRNTVNAGATRIYDRNLTRPNTSPIFIGQFDASTIQWSKFLPFTRRTIPTLDTTIKFALMLFGALTVKQPARFWQITNCAHAV